MPAVNPEILKWARETAGLSLNKAAKAVGINDARGQTGAERLAALEAGENVPTKRVLANMAKKYRRPLVVFYLNTPPEKGDRGEDFRRIPGPSPGEIDPVLDALIRDIRSRQRLVRSLLEDQDAEPVQFIGSAVIGMDTGTLVSQIINSLNFSIDEFRNERKAVDAFRYLRSKIEEVGIFVLLAGNLGSWHTDISTDEFRGYALSDPIAPLMVINDQDAQVAWSFTALHETAHLWLGSTGISGPLYVDIKIEKFCSDVASEILLPANELAELSNIHSHPFKELIDQISFFADDRNISRSLVAYRLFQANVFTKSKWRKLKEHFYQEWLATRKKSREKSRESTDGPSYYIVRRHRLGSALLGLVDRALSEGIITYTKAGKVLGVKPRNVEPLLRVLSYQGESI